jgi:hypothetical protein
LQFTLTLPCGLYFCPLRSKTRFLLLSLSLCCLLAALLFFLLELALSHLFLQRFQASSSGFPLLLNLTLLASSLVPSHILAQYKPN